MSHDNARVAMATQEFTPFRCHTSLSKQNSHVPHAIAIYVRVVLMTGAVLTGLEDVAASEAGPEEAGDKRGVAAEHKREWKIVLG